MSKGKNLDCSDSLHSCFDCIKYKVNMVNGHERQHVEVVFAVAMLSEFTKYSNVGQQCQHVVIESTFCFGHIK